ncbi:DUF1553 domain-containing protein [Gimesia panareensis]|uniref:DUF1553 domain-containing protein n=1 Tax=Gimesia panareensis TaxID=2527978 RepID=UPI0011887EDE|nr:DUF1553 domain-containing protein [Gimesia panareensis]QDU51640.1 Planctomycete cytochrome C [Gimesia panareensis]
MQLFSLRRAGLSHQTLMLFITVIFYLLVNQTFCQAGHTPLVRAGLSEQESFPVHGHGSARQLTDGTLSFTDRQPWGWFSIGQDRQPLPQLARLKSLTICGWVRPTSLQTGSGGNRIAFNLNKDKAGFDLVHLPDGRLRLAINEWPDRVNNDSSSGRLQQGQWTFFAVTYDSTKQNQNVHWYFGDLKHLADPDQVTTYRAGPTGSHCGPLTIGNFNHTMHSYGLDRQFRGQIRGIEIFGSTIGSGGVLSRVAIHTRQLAGKPGPALLAQKLDSKKPVTKPNPVPQAKPDQVSLAKPQKTGARFFRGLNLNGPAVTIDGRRWEGKSSKTYRSQARSFENQQVSLIPSTDAERSKMIRSSRWGQARVELQQIPAGDYTLFVYVWEDNDPEQFALQINGRTVLPRFDSGRAGHWSRLGPWYVKSNNGSIVLNTTGGAANLSGIELWQGHYDGPPADSFSEEQLTFFETRIRPLLVKHCYECHSTESDDLQGGLLVDSQPTLRRGGDSGPALIPGDTKHSLLLKAVRFEEGLEMPPQGKLSPRDIADLERWVKQGAPDPRQNATRYVRKKIDLEKARQFWSLKPLQRPRVPAVSDPDWSDNEIDRFILSTLKQRGLQPLPQADKRTLIRRATYDLTGLPPSPQEIERFLADQSPNAFERLVDRLLESPHYGERWGRHWMDLVRYADTAGDNSDYPIPQAYLYRNYIIDSFNADKPYDQFVREQIAGDLLPAASDDERNQHTIATGYLALSRRFGSVINNYPQHLTIEDTINNLSRTLMGLTVGCARCHDHKFDPITQEDYYGLYGIFESTRYPFPGIELDKKPRDLVPLVKNGKPTKELAFAMDEGKPGDTQLHIQGNPERRGDLVPRKFLEVLGGDLLPNNATSHSGRLQLANWITNPENPLTARVMVNRIWQYHFGTGIVSTPSDFGSRGRVPTHPELLDWLATQFIEDGWSVKQIHRRIMLSQTYQLSSRSGGADFETAHQVDPGNSLHWRFDRQRLDAETLRDTLLLHSGKLKLDMPRQPHPFPPVKDWKYTQHHPFRDSYDTQHRSVYLMTARLNSRPFFTAFDGADRNSGTPVRDSSVTTVQSLYLLNDEFVHHSAEAYSRRLMQAAPDSSQRLTNLFLETLGRLPAAAEQRQIEQWLKEMQQSLQQAGTPEKEIEPRSWSALARSLFRTNEFLYID